MQRKPKTTKHKTKLLTDPHPSNVSLVGAGANMQPFRSVKADVVTAVEHTDETVGPRRFEFSSEVFKTADDVGAWLDAHGYDDAEVTEVDGGGWTASSKNATAEFLAEAKPAALEPGVTVYVAKVVEATTEASKTDTKPSSTAPVPDAVETAKSADPVPVRSRKDMYDINEMSSLIRSLLYIADDRAWEIEYSGSAVRDPATVAALREHAKGLVEILQKISTEEMAAFASYVDAATTVTSVKEDATDTPPVPALEPTAKADEPAAVPAGMEALVAAMTALTAKVDGLSTAATKADEARVAAEAALAAERAKAVEAPVSVRRGVDVEQPATPPAPAVDHAAAARERARKQAIGF